MMLNEKTVKRITAEVAQYFRGTLETRLRAGLEEAFAEGYQAGRTKGLTEARETKALEDSYNKPDLRTLEDVFSEEARKASEGTFDKGEA